MLICHCQQISDHEIRAAVDWMRAADPTTVITPGKVYHALGKRADCGGCMPLFLDTMRQCDSFGVNGSGREDRMTGSDVPILRNVKGGRHEGRS